MTASTLATSPAPSSARQYHGSPVPAAGVYDLDQAHTTVEFVARDRKSVV
jgi:hypothetical protein